MCAKSQNNTHNHTRGNNNVLFVYSSILMRLMNGEMNWLVRITYYIGSIFIKLLTFFIQNHGYLDSSQQKIAGQGK